MKRNWILPGILALALVLLASRRGGGGVTVRLQGAAPSWTMRDLKGMTVRSEDFAGRTVVLNFWATWCPPCRREIPDFIEFARRHDSNRVVILGASIDESAEAVRAFVNARDIPYPVLLADGLVQAAFGPLEGVPTTFVIDAQGRFVSRHIGSMTLRQLEAAVNSASDPAAAPAGPH